MGAFAKLAVLTDLPAEARRLRIDLDRVRVWNWVFHARNMPSGRVPPQSGPTPPAISAVMDTQDTMRLSPSEKLTLKYVAEGELHMRELDWLAVQRLAQAGLIEERRTGRPTLTAAGRRILQRLMANV